MDVGVLILTDEGDELTVSPEGNIIMIGLDEYKLLIDEIVNLDGDISAQWIKEGKSWPDVEGNSGINTFISSLNLDQKKVLCRMLLHSRNGGIHDLLVLLNDKITIDDLRLSISGTKLAVEPFGTGVHNDWSCRRDGDDWPEPES